MERTTIIRNAELSDYPALDTFLKGNPIIHQHLDWRKPLDWIGHSPYLILEKKGVIQGVLICPSDIHDVFWIRLFATTFNTSPQETFKLLFRRAQEEIRLLSSEPVFASIAYQMWMKHLLEENGWQVRQEVVQLRWNRRKGLTKNQCAESSVSIRKMSSADIARVTFIDQVCFDKLWQHSQDAIERAFEQSAYATIAKNQGAIIAYQISTSSRHHAHIARLAVLPELQRHKIGQELVCDVLNYFNKPWSREITVNTQKENYKSLGLYAKLGFEATNDGFPIYTFKG